MRCLWRRRRRPPRRSPPALLARLRATRSPEDALYDYGRGSAAWKSSSSDDEDEEALVRAGSPWAVSAADRSRESERQYRRVVFSFERWAAHRSTSRYARHIQGFFASRTLKALVTPLTYFATVALAAAAYVEIAVPSLGAPPIVISDASLEITSFALSLLLVFRTDTSYSRWVYALQTWERIRADCTDLARQACHYVEDPLKRAMLTRWAVAFGHAMCAHVRCDTRLDTQLRRVLSEAEAEAVCAVGPSGAPSFVLQVLSELIEQCGLPATRADQLHSSIRSLGSAITICDQLLRVPIPLAYTRHTSRFMFVWLTALPFALANSGLGWATVPVDLAVSYLLLAVDEIGVQIEEPQSILPLEDILFELRSDTEALSERKEAVSELLAASGLKLTGPKAAAGPAHLA